MINLDTRRITSNRKISCWIRLSQASISSLTNKEFLNRNKLRKFSQVLSHKSNKLFNIFKKKLNR